MRKKSIIPVRIGVGIDTARFGHDVTFLGEDRQPAAAPMTIVERRSGYRRLEQALDRLVKRHGDVAFHVRIDAAGKYSDNLHQFLRGLPHAVTISVGEPKRNADYRKAHFPKRNSDRVASHALARYSVVEQPAPTPATPFEFLWLRETAGRLQAQVRPPAVSPAKRSKRWCSTSSGRSTTACRPRKSWKR